MKRLIFILIVLIAGKAYSQRETTLNLRKYDNKKLRFGYTLGYTTMDFVIKPSEVFLDADTVYSIENKRMPGFHLGIVSEYHLVKYLDVRFLPGLSFGERDLKYLIFDAPDSTFSVHKMKIESTFLDFPILFKYSSKRIGNYRAYILAGASMRYDLAAQSDIREEEKPKIRLKPMDYYYEIGFGLDYFFEYFKFSTEIKLAVGMTNVMIYDGTQFSTSIDRMNSRIISISLHFEGGKWEGMAAFMGKLMFWKKKN